MHVQEMIRTHPHAQRMSNDLLIRCVEECYDCAQICTSCADACLGESMVADLRQCIRLDLDCADICIATGTIATRRTGMNDDVLNRMLDACATACRVCAEECERHASQHDHCRICAEACHRCEKACRDAMRSMGARH